MAFEARNPARADRPRNRITVPSSATALTLWLVVVAGVTLALTFFRGRIPTAHVALVYLLLVLIGSSRHGRVVGLVLSVVGFVVFNFFLLPPYHTLAVQEPLDWWVLAAFLVTGGVAAQLFHRAQRALGEAEERTRELDRLAAVGAEGLAAPRAIDAVHALARVFVAELEVRTCQVVLRDQPATALVTEPEDAPQADTIALTDLSEYAAREGRVIGLRDDGTSHVAAPSSSLVSLVSAASEFTALLIPLHVRDAVVGVLVLSDPSGLRLDPARARFADALAPYAALAVERVRLAAVSEHVEALREADRLKDAVIASVSHDLRTPLTTIRALAAELRASGDERAAVIEEEAQRLNRMVSDLLDLSRIRAGALPIETQLTAAEDLVGAILQRLGGIAAEERVVVQLPSDGSLPVGRFDFVQSLRALGNLIENALAHSPTDGVVELLVREEGPDLVFTVLDRGGGVPEADRDRIFEPFFRGARGSSSVPGSGLGLAIARSLAEAQGGSVRFAPRVGGGSAFELRLPSAHLPAIS